MKWMDEKTQRGRPASLGPLNASQPPRGAKMPPPAACCSISCFLRFLPRTPTRHVDTLVFLCLLCRKSAATVHVFFASPPRVGRAAANQFTNDRADHCGASKLAAKSAGTVGPQR